MGRPPRKFTADQLALLGTMDDPEWAALVGCHTHTARNTRIRLGIEAHQPRTTWTPEMDARLGLDPDGDLAEEWGIDVAVVAYRRRQLGIAPPSPGRQWTPEEDALLGTMSDRDLGSRLGLSRPAVELRRLVLGIKAYASTSKTLDPQELTGAGHAAELRDGARITDVAKKHSVARGSVLRAVQRFRLRTRRSRRA